MPISKTNKDYFLSGLTLVGIAVVSALGVYLTHPAKLKKDSTINFLGIEIPNLQGIVMRQPRMSIVVVLSLIIFVTAFIFITREALPFFSRRIAWGSVVVAGVALIAVGFLNSDGRSGSWFRFLVLCLVILGGATLLTELMIFYRKFIEMKTFRKSLWHRIVFALVCATIVGAMGTSYFHFGLKDGAILDYEVNSTIPNLPSEVDPTTTSSPQTDLGTTPSTLVPGLEP